MSDISQLNTYQNQVVNDKKAQCFDVTNRENLIDDILNNVIGGPILWLRVDVQQETDLWIGVGDVCFFLTMRCFNDAMFSNS